MFSKTALVAFASSAILVAALPNEPVSSCTTSPVLCCDSFVTASSASAAKILGLLGIVLQDLNITVGLTCSPITVIGAGGDSCAGSAVCCADDSHGGLIAIGCFPVDLSQ
ncbi:hypothetical protein M422DRAFT_274088 [Sphaerobolus stellatus SS14]|uniref:Hydrophobin n=1 Tax=Sphaerobolus stellatus (strain SS14) TaxID=990650 RepID=A0A0C9U7H0_SPHS4|nr:hypothetical protein M422DRAFT_274088 [Sphaerobolus stellatus SS14]